MKILLLVAGGRAGIDLLQSLLDKHPSISQLPGVFYWGDFYKKIKNLKDLDLILEIFLKEYERYFDSRLNLRERHDQLGENKNEFYTVDKKEFKLYFKKLINLEGGITKINILKFLHLAYSKISGEDLSKKKYIVINIHSLEYLNEFEEFDYEIIHTIRHPMASLSSGFKHWLDYAEGKLISSWSIYYHFERQFNILKKLIKINKKIHLIKLERLHNQSKEVLSKLRKEVGLEHNDTLFISSYHGKKWWGDMLSKKYLNGLNKNFKNNIDKSLFFEKDIFLIEHYLSKFYKYYNYEKISNFKSYFIVFLNLLPLKIEMIIFKREIIKLNFRNIVYLLNFYLKRVYLFQTSDYKKVNFPSYY
tara:strand:+ start:4789 stop:5871 length:1083 start_codon:yes stop_codon:yes gene_type:complete